MRSIWDGIRFIYTFKSPGENVCKKPLTEKPSNTLTLNETHIGDSACIFGYNQPSGVEWKVSGKAENLLFQQSLQIPLPTLNNKATTE